MIITVIPVLLGKGRLLFGSLSSDFKRYLEHDHWLWTCSDAVRGWELKND